MATFVQKGDAVDYTPASDVTAGDVVVQGDLVGVANLDIASGELGALAIEGVFDFPKATGGSTAIGAGSKVYWTGSVANTTAASNTLIGKAVQAATDADATVRVKLNQ